MTTPERFALTPKSSVRIQLPSATSPLSDEDIWRRLKESGFDEESIKRRDKAALIAHISKLEAEMHDLQYHMGLLILEKKDWISKYDQMKASAESAELKFKQERAAQLLALAEGKKREDGLRKALNVEKECIANIEKTLHEMRAESAETKVAAECKLAEAYTMIGDAQKRFSEAEAKFQEAEALQTEADRYHRAAERKLKEVEAREDDLRRRILSLKSEGDAKEKDISLERQALSERQKSVQQEQERLLDAQALLNQREDYIFNKSQELICRGKELENSKMDIDKERRTLNEEITNLELSKASLLSREEAVIEKETMLNKKEQELLILQEKLACKESVDQKKLMVDHEAALRKRTSEFYAELELKRKLVEDEIDNKRRAWELRELDLRQREDQTIERAQDLDVQSKVLQDKEIDLVEKLRSIEEKERNLNIAEKELELQKNLLKKDQEEMNSKMLEVQKSLDALAEKRRQIEHVKDNVEAMKTETDELLVLETKLKEEIDMVRAEKLEIMARAEDLKVEKAKFEAEWEAIDEKREELRKEAERIAAERVTISKFLKDERDCMKLEKDLMREEYKRDVESLRQEREEFMNKMVHERSEWLNKIQQERAGFLLDIEMQKRELENLVDRRREELESHFMEKEKSFELEKKKELANIRSIKETVAKDLEHVASEMRRLDTERYEIKTDRERREREWAELNNSIEELKMQEQKLKKQRELLAADREEIANKIQQLEKLQQLDIARENAALSAMLQAENNAMLNAGLASLQKQDGVSNGVGQDLPNFQSDAGSLNPAPVSWLRRCAKLLFKQSAETVPTLSEETSPACESEESMLPLARKMNLSTGSRYQVFEYRENIQKDLDEKQPLRSSDGEPNEVLKHPLSDEDVYKPLDMETKEMTREGSGNGYTEEGVPAGKKRKSEIPVSHDICNSEVQDGRNKKRRQQDAIESAPEPTITHCEVSASSRIVEKTMLIQADGTLVIDNIVDVTEVTHLHVDGDKIVSQDKEVLSLNLAAEQGEDILKHEESNGHAKTSLLENHARTHENMQNL